MFIYYISRKHKNIRTIKWEEFLQKKKKTIFDLKDWWIKVLCIKRRKTSKSYVHGTSTDGIDDDLSQVTYRR